jgi:hypothetical protein
MPPVLGVHRVRCEVCRHGYHLREGLRRGWRACAEHLRPASDHPATGREPGPQREVTA